MIDALITQVHHRRVSDAYESPAEWECSVILVGGAIGTGRGPTRWTAEFRAMANIIDGNFSDGTPRGV